MQPHGTREKGSRKNSDPVEVQWRYKSVPMRLAKAEAFDVLSSILKCKRESAALAGLG